jgi:tRNA (adenine37-N6)-methyltransferase
MGAAVLDWARGFCFAHAMIEMKPIGHVHCERLNVDDDYWGGSQAVIVLTEEVEPEALDGLEQFSHAEIVYVFDRVAPEKIVRGARHPRSNPDWPKTGILAQRSKSRPNRIGTSIVRILRREAGTLVVAELDAVNGTPVLDIKPVMQEFLPRTKVWQPEWAQELMRNYWRYERWE